MGSRGAARAQAVAIEARPPDSLRGVSLTLGHYAAAAASGPLVAAGFLDPRLFALAWVAFVPLFRVLRRAATTREAVRAAFAAGFITNFLGFYWLMHTMHVFGGFPWGVAVFFYLCLTAYSACQFVLLALAVRRAGFAGLGIAPALIWTALEFLYPNLFPWRMANTQFHLTPLLQAGDLAGPFLLSLAIVWVNAAVVLAFERPRRLAPLAAALSLVAAILAYGLARMPQIDAAMRAAPTLRVALVQGNVSIERKRDAAYIDVNIDRYRALSEAVQDRADLLIWPETVAQWWVDADATALAPEHHPFPGLRTRLIYGGLAYRFTGAPEPEAFNSAFLMDAAGGPRSRYDKRILLPFGEYIPGAGVLPGLKRLSPHTGDFTPGRELTTFAVPGAVLGPLICYEDVVVGIPREMVRRGAQVLFNILNDAWFGDTAGPHEHQLLALWRAVENRRYLLRASNSGTTSIIDPLGRVAGELDTFREDVLLGEVQPLAMMTFYTRFGDVFGWTAVAAALLSIARRRSGWAP